MRRVVVTGIGVITPVGIDTQTFWNNCLAAVSPVAPIPEAWKPYYNFSSTIWAPLAQVDFLRYRINRIEIMQNDMIALIALAASQQALSMAGVDVSLRNEKKNVYALNNIHAERCGVFIGTGIGGITSFAANEANHILAPVHAQLHDENPGTPRPQGAKADSGDFSRLVRFPPRYHPFAAAMSMPNTAAAALGIKYSLHGANLTVCNACAAGTTAIGRAFMAVRSGEADCALAGGVEYLRDDYGGIFRAFDVAKTLVRAGADPAAANRPFDKGRTGFLFAEGGGAMLMLESLDHARSRKAAPLAEICSFVETFDGFSMMSPDPSGGAAECMVRTAVANAGMCAGDVDYINAHGTGTPLNDEIEAGVIERVFENKPLVNATKSLTGHSIGASGAIETAVTALSIQSQTTHICKNLDNPIRPLRFVREVRPYPIRAALTQSFAFGGHNAALVLSRY
jgi:3-oxoacyl-[acyl-carrier-protein] synthase II